MTDANGSEVTSELGLRLSEGPTPRAMILVEGASDQAALETLARRHGRDLSAEMVSIVPMGGATTIRHYLDLLGPHGLGIRLAGLCDVGEELDFRRGLELTGLGTNLTRADMEEIGFFVCVIDLEDELIRALGTTTVEQIIDSRGELGSFRILQQQPAQRERSIHQQLVRFMGTRSGRKVLYARLMVEALDLALVPRPLDLVLAAV